MNIADVNALNNDEFAAQLGHLFEHSPWVVIAAAGRRPFADAEEMLMAFRAVLDEVGEEKQLDLLRAHPELAGKAAIDGALTTASESEQASAGLDRLTPGEFALFHERNSAYGSKFGFPFIICVRLTNKAGILEAMRVRLGSDRVTEFQIALDEVMRIVRLRLKETVS